MQYYNLTKSLSISRLILGTWQFVDNHASSCADYTSILSAYINAGVSTITTANIYPGVEAKIGDYLKSQRSDHASGELIKPQIMTIFTAMPNQLHDFTEEDILAAVDGALERLQIEKIDLIQFFCWAMPDKIAIKVGRALTKAVELGKIAALGAVNMSTNTLEALINEGIHIVSNQVPYSILDRRAESKMMPFCQKHDIALLTYGTLCGGFLSEKYLGQSQAADNLSLQKYQATIDAIGGWDVFQSVLERLCDLASSLNVSVSQLVSAYVLEQPMVASIILGAHNTKHLESSLAILDIKLSKDNIEKINAIISELKAMPGDIYESEIERELTTGRLKPFVSYYKE